MVTIQEARRSLELYFAEHPPAISGELYVCDEWYEDEQDLLPVWGSRQFHVDGIEAYARCDNLAIFVDKRTGAVRQEFHTPNFAKISRMTAVATTSGPDSRLAAVGRALFAKLTDNPTLTLVELPDGLGICLVHAARGGGKIYVAPDETVLFVGSAVTHEAGLDAFRDGARTPLEGFGKEHGGHGA